MINSSTIIKAKALLYFLKRYESLRVASIKAGYNANYYNSIYRSDTYIGDFNLQILEDYVKDKLSEVELKTAENISKKNLPQVVFSSTKELDLSPIFDKAEKELIRARKYRFKKLLENRVT